MRSCSFFLHRQLVLAASLLVALAFPRLTDAQAPFGPPNPADPFGGGAAAADPFGARQDPAQDPANIVGAAVREATWICESWRGQHAGDPEIFEAALCLLEYATQTPDSDPARTIDWILPLKALSKPRRAAEDEPIGDLVQRLNQAAKDAQSFKARRLHDCRRSYHELTSKPWPLDWRRREATWLKLAEIIVKTQYGETTNAEWRTLAAELPDGATLCRLAYVISLRGAVGEWQVDQTFIDPLIRQSDTLAAEGGLRLKAEMLLAMQQTGAEPKHPVREQLRDAIFALLIQHAGDSVNVDVEWTATLADIYRYGDPQLESQPLMRTLLIHSQPAAFEWFARTARLGSQRTQQLWLAKPVVVNAQNQPVSQVLAELTSKVALPLWVDETAQADSRLLTLGRLQGPWLETLLAVAQPAGYRLELLGRDLLWLGKPERFAAARDSHAYGAVQIQAAHARTAGILEERTRVEFVQCPLEDVVAYLRDQHEVIIECLAFGDAPVTERVRNLPFHVFLSHMAAKLGCQWCTSGEFIFIGSPADIQRVHERDRNRLKRWTRLGVMETAAARALRDDTRIEFIETPLEQVAGYLADQHQIPFEVTPAVAKLPVSRELKGITLEEALDACFTLSTELDWYTDGHKIVIGTKDEIAAL